MAVTDAPPTETDTSAPSDEPLALPGESAALELPRPRGVSPLAMGLFVGGIVMSIMRAILSVNELVAR